MKETIKIVSSVQQQFLKAQLKLIPKSYHIIDSPRTINRLIHLKNLSLHEPSLYDKLRSPQSKQSFFGLLSYNQKQFCRDNYKIIQQTLSYYLNIVQCSQKLAFSDVLLYKQQILSYFFSDFVDEMSKQCVEKGQLLSFIWKSMISAIKMIITSVTQVNGKSEKQYFQDILKCHQTYQQMIEITNKKQKQREQQTLFNEKLIDTLVSTLRFKRKEINKLYKSVHQTTQTLNQYKNCYIDLHSEHINLLMNDQNITQDEALHLANKRKQINQARRVKIVCKQTKKAIKKKIQQQIRDQDLNNCQIKYREAIKQKFREGLEIINTSSKTIQLSIFDSIFMNVLANNEQQPSDLVSQMLKIQVPKGISNQSTSTHDFITKINTLDVSTSINFFQKAVENMITNKATQTNTAVKKKEIYLDNCIQTDKLNRNGLEINKVYELNFYFDTYKPKKSIMIAKGGKFIQSQQQFKINLKEMEAILKKEELMADIEQQKYNNEDDGVSVSSLQKSSSRKSKFKGRRQGKITFSTQRQSQHSEPDIYPRNRTLRSNLKTNTFTIIRKSYNEKEKSNQTQMEIQKKRKRQKQRSNAALEGQFSKTSPHIFYKSKILNSKNRRETNLIKTPENKNKQLFRNAISKRKSVNYTSIDQTIAQYLKKQGNIVDQQFFNKHIHKMIAPIKQDVIKAQQKRGISNKKLIPSTVKSLIKTLSQVYNCAYQMISHNQPLNNFIKPLFKCFEIGYGTIKNSEIYSRMLNFLVTICQHKEENFLFESFLFFLGMPSLKDQIKSPFRYYNIISTFDVRIYLKLVEKMSPSWSLPLNLDNLYTTNRILKDNLLQILSEMNIGENVAQKVKISVFENILSSLPYQGLDQDIKLNVFKCSQNIVEYVIIAKYQIQTSYYQLIKMFSPSKDTIVENLTNVNKKIVNFLIQCQCNTKLIEVQKQNAYGIMACESDQNLISMDQLCNICLKFNIPQFNMLYYSMLNKFRLKENQVFANLHNFLNFIYKKADKNKGIFQIENEITQKLNHSSQELATIITNKKIITLVFLKMFEKQTSKILEQIIGQNLTVLYCSSLWNISIKNNKS